MFVKDNINYELPSTQNFEDIRTRDGNDETRDFMFLQWSTYNEVGHLRGPGTCNKMHVVHFKRRKSLFSAGRHLPSHGSSIIIIFMEGGH